MYTLIMILAIWGGNATYGGPYIKDGFKSEAACMAYAAKIKAAIDKVYDRPLVNSQNIFEQITCVKMD